MSTDLAPPPTCERTWQTAPDIREDVYPQHRCRHTAGHQQPCVCRYCDTTRAGRTR